MGLIEFKQEEFMSIITNQKTKRTKRPSPIQAGHHTHTAPFFSSSSKRWLLFAGLLIVALLTWLLRQSLAEWLAVLSDQAYVSSYVQSYGALAPLILAALQVLQVIVAFIPGHVFVIAGGYIYGLPWGLIFNIVCVVSASQLGFLLARWFGRPIVNRLAAPENDPKMGNAC